MRSAASHKKQDEENPGTKQTLQKKTVGFLPWEIIKNRGIF
jgi:hypothetical protein